MNSLSILRAASSALVGGAGPNVRIIGQEPDTSIPNGGDGPNTDAHPSTDPNINTHPSTATDPLSNMTPAKKASVRTEAAPKGLGKRTRAQRRANNACQLAAAKGSGKQPPARPAQASEADEGPEPYRLRGDDEKGWMIDGDPLLRVWDTAADAIAEVPGDWWEEESGCWMATAIEPSADNARQLAAAKGHGKGE